MNIVLRLKSEIESIFVQEAHLASFVAVVSLVPTVDSIFWLPLLGVLCLLARQYISCMLVTDPIFTTSTNCDLFLNAYFY